LVPLDMEDDDSRYRRLRPYSVTRDGRVLRSAYEVSRKNPDISVNLARLSSLEATAATPRANSSGEARGADELSTQVPRDQLGLIVRHTPDEAPDNPAHSSIIGIPSKGEENKRKRDALANATDPEIWPAQLAIDDLD
jgi:hypothetical protein